ncbi:DUF92 domain-containing protein [Salinispira pacifica]|uniref:DUF92 domain-containing protein n=1 Tax=Salinispira pacifica TaxID=1307761 RepID=V5WK11_9SPIO|nr:DUF92 domain-containing protein [Salinispira pacifica]AHC15929.1 hypothetical protein L21SP2_2577 [Salinispira pacifica]
MRDFLILGPLENLNAAFLFIRISAAVAANLLLAYTAYRKGSVDGSGAAAGFGLGFAIYLGGGISAWFVLGLFFVSSSLLSRLGKVQKTLLEKIHDKGSIRDAWQAGANAAPAAACMLGFAATGSPMFAAGFLGSMACAASDTWASELGVLSGARPRSIISWKPLQKGQSGAVSIPGTLASAAGAGTIALGSVPLLYLLPGGFLWKAIALPAAVSGFAGSLIDSVLGATVQALYEDSHGNYTEKRYETLYSENRGDIRIATRLVKGYSWITNDMVNIISNAASSLLAITGYLILS